VILLNGILNGFKWLIDTIKFLVGLLMSLVKAITMLFQYLITIVNLAFTTIVTLPPFIQAFAYITIAISIIYIIVGRNTGKSD
jgi:hypothetical protein